MDNQYFSTNTGITAIPEFSQSDYPQIYVDSIRIRNGIKILQAVLDNYTGALGEDPAYWSQVEAGSWDRIARLTRIYAKATENIAAGAVVNFHDNGGTLGVRNANGSVAGKSAHAWSGGAVTSGAYGEFFREGVCYLIGSLTIGTTYYLSGTNGLISNVPGTIPQRVGYAIGTNTLVFKPTLV